MSPLLPLVLLGLKGTNTGDPQNRSGGTGPISTERIQRQTVPIRGTEKPGPSVQILGDGVRRTIAARNNEITVSGSKNDVRITGRARSVRVLGDANRLNIERADRIEVRGARNLLLVIRTDDIRLDGGNNSALVRSAARFRVTTKGVGNRVTRAKGRG